MLLGGNEMRVILLTHGGAELVIENIIGLENIELAGVFIETATTPIRGLREKLKRSVKYDGYFETLKKMVSIFSKSKSSSEITENQIVDSRQLTISTAEKHSIPVFYVENYHNQRSIDLIRKCDADLGVIFGTNIVKEIVFSIPTLGSINLHQGLAPYYRGGPPVFWELFNDEKEVGLTVHFVASKVDTGDIILQETVPLSYDFTFGVDFEPFLDEFRANLTTTCAMLVSKAVRLIESGDFPRIKQDINLGKRYRLPVKSEKNELKRRLKVRKRNNFG